MHEQVTKTPLSSTTLASTTAAPMSVSDLLLITYDCMRWRVALGEDEKVLSSVHDGAGSVRGCKKSMGSCCSTAPLQGGTERRWWVEILLIDFR